MPYSNILIICETNHGQIHKVAFELLNKGRQLADIMCQDLHCLLLTNEDVDAKALCERGADKVYVMKSTAFRYLEEELFSKNIARFIKENQPSVVLFGATSFGRSLAPRIAASLKTGLTADCTDLKIDADGKLVQIRPAFSDNILAHIKTVRLPQMATVRYKEFNGASVDYERKICIQNILPYVEENPSVKVNEVYPIGDMDITEAQVVVAGGRGIKCQKDLEMLKELADVLGGQMGVSRALVDASMAPSSIQIGYSGNRVKPKIYIACGISGAPQHLAGMKESGYIIAINSDASAPIFKVADLGIVGDIYKIVPQMIINIRRHKECTV